MEIRATWIPKTTSSIITVILALALLAVPLGCAQKAEKPANNMPAAPQGYPVVEEFKDVGQASKAAGFEIKTPGYTMGSKLDHVNVVKVTDGRKYVELVYNKELTISETPSDGSSNYQKAMAEHQEYINALPPRLQTYEKPETVEIAGHKGILWTHKEDIIVEERPVSEVESFHMPYLIWWDDALEYRLSIDDPQIFEPDPAAGTQELQKIAASIY